MRDGIGALFEGGALLDLPGGATLFRRGDPVARMTLVLSGSVRLVRMTAGGTEIVLQRAGPGQVVAEASAYAEAYYCDAEATGPVHALVLRRAAFLDRLSRHPALAAG